MPKIVASGKSITKINLGLNVIGIEQDYCLIDTIIIPIDKLYDEITIYETDGNEDVIEETYENQIFPRRLLKQSKTYTALRKIKEATQNKKTYHIKIRKNIPLGSGLGGVSSNVAFIIKSLNNLSKNKLDFEKLKKLAASISVDASAFITNQDVRAIGRGGVHALLFFNVLDYLNIEIIQLPHAISTKLVYNHYRDHFSSKQSSIDNVITSILQSDFKALKKYLRNDLHESIIAINSELEKEFEKYKSDDRIVIFTGAGSNLLRIKTKTYKRKR